MSFDLFAQGDLSEEQLFRGSCNVAGPSQRDNVLQMSEFHETGHSPQLLYLTAAYEGVN